MVSIGENTSSNTLLDTKLLEEEEVQFTELEAQFWLSTLTCITRMLTFGEIDSIDIKKLLCGPDITV